MLRGLILRSALRVAPFVALLIAPVGCGLFFDTSTLGSGAAVATADEGGTSNDAAGSDAGDATTIEAGNGCPVGEGPSMVRIDDFCIDSTEVTRAQYARFVSAMGADAGGPNVPQCADNTTFEPVVSQGFPAPPPETPEFPVHGVDWCDAKAYCQWTGKDLCGGLGGATLAVADATDPAKSQWEKACSKNGTQRFGYSDSYTSGRCVDGQKNYSPKNATCEGGYPGLFDLVGNVAEWIDACKPPLDIYAPCALMGGRGSGDEIASCTSTAAPEGRIPWDDAGIRCCAPAKD